MDIYSALIPEATANARETIGETLAKFGCRMLKFAHSNDVRIRPLKRSESYREASPVLARLGIDVDAWPAPPAGLFVVEERRVYLRKLSPMTIAHEFAHALDCALGRGVYRSGIDADIRNAFANATVFVTPYAASGIDEYFAESVRAYVGVSDPVSHWPMAASRDRLLRVDPAMYGVVKRIFDHVAAV
jgi:hypothetical protein